MKCDRVITAAGAFLAGGIDGWIAIVLFSFILIVATAGDHYQEKMDNLKTEGVDHG